MKLRLMVLWLWLGLVGSAQAAFEGCLDYFTNRTPPVVSVSPGQLRDVSRLGEAAQASLVLVLPGNNTG